MASSKMLFVVPAETAALAEILADHGGYLEYERDLEDFTDYLAERVGERLTAEFEDLDDPDAALCDFARELGRQRTPFIGACDSYEERSRGDRFDGYIAYDLGGDDGKLVTAQHAWRHGDPDVDERSLRAAGVGEDEIARISSVLFSDPRLDGTRKP